MASISKPQAPQAPKEYRFHSPTYFIKVGSTEKNSVQIKERLFLFTSNKYIVNNKNILYFEDPKEKVKEETKILLSRWIEYQKQLITTVEKAKTTEREKEMSQNTNLLTKSVNGFMSLIGNNHPQKTYTSKEIESSGNTILLDSIRFINTLGKNFDQGELDQHIFKELLKESGFIEQILEPLAHLIEKNTENLKQKFYVWNTEINNTKKPADQTLTATQKTASSDNTRSPSPLNPKR